LITKKSIETAVVSQVTKIGAHGRTYNFSGVKNVIKLLKNELDLAMALAGTIISSIRYMIVLSLFNGMFYFSLDVRMFIID
jgi:hypothetical protein